MIGLGHAPAIRRFREVADGCHAYLQADGSWGWSNAGLIVGDGVSLSVDTLFDLKLTQAMLDSMRPITLASPIAQVVNTHANGDHCFGNILLDNTEIIASSATAHEISEVPPALPAGLNSAPGEVGDMSRSRRVRLRWHRDCDCRIARSMDASTSMSAGGLSS